MHYAAPIHRMHRASSFDDSEDRPILPSICRIFERTPSRHSYRPPVHQEQPLTLPPLSSYESSRPRSVDQWSQYSLPVDNPETWDSNKHNEEQYYDSRMRDAHYDPRLSAQQTNHAMHALASARSFSPSTMSEDSFHSPSSMDHNNWNYAQNENYRSNETYPPSPRNSRRYDPIASHRFSSHSPSSPYEEQGVRHRAMVPTLQRSVSAYEADYNHLSAKARHQCTHCGKRFSRPSGLKIHITTHTGDKPYVCTEDGCGRSFSVRSNMRRHVRIVHQIPPHVQGASESSDEPDGSKSD